MDYSASFDQQRLLESDKWLRTSFPDTRDKETGDLVKNTILRHKDDTIEVVHHKHIQASPFYGLDIMSTNKEIHEEVAKVLYGQNYFVFDLRYNAVTPSYWNNAVRLDWEANQHRIPGLDLNENSSTQSDTSAAINDLLFKKKSGWRKYERDIPNFVDENALLRFLWEVGPKNASLLKKIKIEGHFKVGPRDSEDDTSQ